MPKINHCEEIILSKADRRRFYKSVERMNKAISELREGVLYIEAVRCYMIRKYKLYLESGKSWKVYKEEVLQLSRATVDRYISAAKKIESWALHTYEAKQNEAFLITSDMILDFIKERQSKGLSIDIKSLIENGKEESAIEEQSSESVVETSLETTTTASEQGNLFSLHDKIEQAGYSWQKERGKFITPEGEVMNDSELAEFVDDETGLKLFEETKKVLTPVRKDIKCTIEQFKRYYLAYASKHHSPKFQALIEEKHTELRDEVLGILHVVSTMLTP